MVEAFGTLAKQRGHAIQRRHRCPHLSSKGTSIIKQRKRAGFLASTGKLQETRSNNSLKFFLGDLGAGTAPALLHLQLTAIEIRLERIQFCFLFKNAANGRNGRYRT
jgi:hypothetical protein